MADNGVPVGCWRVEHAMGYGHAYISSSPMKDPHNFTFSTPRYATT